MRIAVMGTGGTGGYYGALLARNRHEVTFIARGPHLRAMQTNGLQIKSIHGDFEIKGVRATDDPGEVSPVDLLLFCTKTYDTDQASLQARPMVAEGTTVLSLQNGIDATERVGNVLGMAHMLAGTTMISSAVEAPGVIRQVSEFRRVVVGELDGRLSPRVQAVCDAFMGTGVTVEVSERIMSVLWGKLLFIAVAAGFGSLTRLPVGDYRSVPETRSLITRLMRETEALATAQNVKLPPDVVESTLATMDQNAPQIKASMQLDVERGRRTELDSIIGVLCRKGRELGVPTPVADMIYGMLLPVDLAASGQAQAFNDERGIELS
jgi:2-dehydropantoate 2-reductase